MRECKEKFIKKFMNLIDFEKIDGFYFISELEDVIDNVLKMLCEITECRTIALAFYDSDKERYNVKKLYKKGEYRSYYGDLKLELGDMKPYTIDTRNKIILENVDLQNLRAENIVLLKKESLTGFISFSSMESEKIEYLSQNKEIFEMIDFVLKIAENNHVNMFNMDLMEKQKMQLTTLYDVVANIQSAVTLEELFENLLSTMSIVYKVTESCIIEKTSSKTYTILKSRGIFGEIDDEINCLEQSNFGKIDYSYSTDEIKSKFEGLEISEEGNCSVIAPIDKRLLGLDSIGHAEYYWLITRVENGLKLELIQSIEMIIKMISSMYSNYKIKKIQSTNSEEHNSEFLRKLAEKIDDRQKYDIDFYLSYKRIRFNPLQKIDKKYYEEFDIVGDYAFDIGFDPYLKEEFKEIEGIQTIEEFLNYKLE